MKKILTAVALMASAAGLIGCSTKEDEHKLEHKTIECVHDYDHREYKAYITDEYEDRTLKYTIVFYSDDDLNTYLVYNNYSTDK